jgi:hypothetical protein
MLGRAVQPPAAAESEAQVSHRGAAGSAFAMPPASLSPQATATLGAARSVGDLQHAHRMPVFMTASVSSRAEG